MDNAVGLTVYTCDEERFAEAYNGSAHLVVNSFDESVDGNEVTDVIFVNPTNTPFALVFKLFSKTDGRALVQKILDEIEPKSLHHYARELEKESFELSERPNFRVTHVPQLTEGRSLR
ncbi:hypothetical protein D8S78_22420 [Natrialba swarupiae]|nr:hypothetical protein [Natrialba swarupiae]